RICAHARRDLTLHAIPDKATRRGARSCAPEAWPRGCFPGNLEFPSAVANTAYRLGHDRTHTTMAHHLDPAHRADALRWQKVAGDRALARNGYARVQGVDYGSRLTAAGAGTRTGRGDRFRF